MIPAHGALASTSLLLRGMVSPASPDSLRALTRRLARGDDSAWSEFHRSYGPAMFRQLLAAARGDYALASEALQAAYLRIAKHVRACDSGAMFESWLRVVARTALADCRRRRRTWWQRFTFAGEENTAPDEARSNGDDGALLAGLEVALQALDPADRSLLEAKYLSRLSVRELAAQLSVSEKAVESRLTRARLALRIQLTSVLARHEPT